MSEDTPSSYTEEEFERNVSTLKSMGVDDEEHIRQILRQTSNDLQVSSIFTANISY